MHLPVRLSLALVACTQPSDDVLTYDEFRAQAHVDPDTDVFVINGDQPIASELEMEIAYDAYLSSVADARLRAEGLAVAEQGLAVYNIAGADVRWTAAEAMNLTYCIDRKGFGTRYNSVVAAMATAAGAWEGVASMDFIHSSGDDGKCNSRTNGVVFNVRQVTTTQYLARAFFPNAARRNREILISTSSFGNIAPWTLEGVLRHELGHTLGFRHEHTRPEAGACFEDNNWRALTAYDASSVMHYPQCNGTQNGDLVLTNADRAGAAAVY